MEGHRYEKLARIFADPKALRVFKEFQQVTGVKILVCSALDDLSPKDIADHGCGQGLCLWFKSATARARNECGRLHAGLRKNALEWKEVSYAKCSGGFEHVAVPLLCDGKSAGLLNAIGLSSSIDEKARVWVEVVNLIGQVASVKDDAGDWPNKEISGNALPVILVRAIKFAEENHHRADLSSAQVASAVGVTPQRLAQLFRRFLGETFTDWLSCHRISIAMRLLRDGQSRILDISGECGFAALSSFNRNFRKWTGISPRHYRQGVEPAARSFKTQMSAPR